MNNLSAERRAGNRVSPVQGNRFGVDYRGVRNQGAGAGAANNRSNSRDRIPKVNNYTKVMQRISPARPEAAENNENTVFNRLYGRAKPGAPAAARSLSKDRKVSNERGTGQGGAPVPQKYARQFNSQGRGGFNQNQQQSQK